MGLDLDAMHAQLFHRHYQFDTDKHFSCFGDQLRRGEAESRTISEVCVWHGPVVRIRSERWWLSAVWIRNVFAVPQLAATTLLLAPTEDIMGERFFRWTRMKKGKEER